MRSPDRWRDERDPRKRAERVVTWFADDGRGDPSRADHGGRGPRGYRRADRRILEDVSDRLTDDPDVDASEIEVGVRDGEVTFEGTVGDRAQRRRAENIAERVPGVTHVQNNLRLGPRDRVEALLPRSEPAAPAAAPAERTVTALFDSLGDAHRAADHLAGLGITRSPSPGPKAGARRNRAGRRLLGLPHRPVRVGLGPPRDRGGRAARRRAADRTARRWRAR